MSPAISTGPAAASWLARMPRLMTPTSWRPVGDLGLGSEVHGDDRNDVAVDALQGDPVGVADAPVQMLAGLLPEAVAHQGRALVDRCPAVGAPGDRRGAGVRSRRTEQRVAGRGEKYVLAVGHFVVGDKIRLVRDHGRRVGLEVDVGLTHQQVRLRDPDDSWRGWRKRCCGPRGGAVLACGRRRGDCQRGGQQDGQPEETCRESARASPVGQDGEDEEARVDFPVWQGNQVGRER